MPGFTTHYLFGLDTYQQLNSISLKETLKQQHAAYSLGLQGPDLFFYFLPSYLVHKNNIGSVAHTEKTQKFLSALIHSRKLFSNKKQQEIAKAYITGFLGHYTLDTHCHPYIYWKTNFREKNNCYYGNHMSLETDIDTELLQLYKHCLPSTFPQNATIQLTRLQLRTIATILYYVYKKTYPDLNIHYITMYISIRSIQYGTKLLRDPSGRKKSMIEALECLFLGYPLLSTLIPSDTLTIHIDPLNTLHKQWKNPWDTSQVSKDSFFDLMEDAQKSYLELLLNLNQLFVTKTNTSLEKICTNEILKKLGNNSYHSGLDASIPS